MNRFFRDRVLAGGNLERIGRRGEVQIVGLNPARTGVVTGVRMYGDKQICLALIGNGGARLQRDKRIVVAGVNHLCTHLFLQKFSQAQCHVEHQIFFLQAIRTHGAGVMPAMAGVNHDSSDLQSQCPDQGALSVGGRPRLAADDVRVCFFYFFVPLFSRRHLFKGRRARGFARGLDLRLVRFAHRQRGRRIIPGNLRR